MLTQPTPQMETEMKHMYAFENTAFVAGHHVYKIVWTLLLELFPSVEDAKKH